MLSVASLYGSRLDRRQSTGCRNSVSQGSKTSTRHCITLETSESRDFWSPSAVCYRGMALKILLLYGNGKNSGSIWKWSLHSQWFNGQKRFAFGANTWMTLTSKREYQTKTKWLILSCTSNVQNRYGENYYEEKDGVAMKFSVKILLGEQCFWMHFIRQNHQESKKMH